MDTTPRQSTHVVLGSDEGFVRPLAVTLRSLATNCSDTSLTVHVVADGISTESRRRLEVSCAPLTINWIEPRPDDYDGIGLPAFLSRATLFRLSLGSLLPDIDHVLYLDADLIVVDDLTQLLDQPAIGYIASAATDTVVQRFGGPWGPPWADLGVRPNVSYFNAGVMQLDLDAMREEQIDSRSLALLRRHRLPFADQCALNTLFVGRWHRLHPRWNVQSNLYMGAAKYSSIAHAQEIGEAAAHPAVIHFTSASAKPWRGDTHHPWSDRWFEILDSTPFAGWRPSGRSLKPRSLLGDGRHRATKARVRVQATVRDRVGPAVGSALGSSDSTSAVRRGMTRRLLNRTEGMVGDGPFFGVAIPTEAREFVEPSQVLGCYQAELHPLLTALVARAPAQVIVFGADDPVRPAGIATRIESTTIHVYDDQPDRLAAVREVASANSVGTRVITHLTDLVDLDPAVESTWICTSPRSHRVINSHAAQLRETQLIVACMDEHDPTFTPSIVRGLSTTHDATWIERTSRLPTLLPVIESLPHELRCHAVTEVACDAYAFLSLAPITKREGDARAR